MDTAEKPVESGKQQGGTQHPATSDARNGIACGHAEPILSAARAAFPPAASHGSPALLTRMRWRSESWLIGSVPAGAR